MSSTTPTGSWRMNRVKPGERGSRSSASASGAIDSMCPARVTAVLTSPRLGERLAHLPGDLGRDALAVPFERGAEALAEGDPLGDAGARPRALRAGSARQNVFDLARQEPAL